MANDGPILRAAVYCRKSSEEGLEQSFNSLHAQREACEAFITSQRHEGWRVLPTHYDDGGYSGGSLERPAVQQLLQDVKDGKINVIVVYKVDRLTRSLADFAKIIEILDAHKASFVSVTQQFNTTSSMGRLTLNVLLSFAQFEREVTGERIRDKLAASKRKGMWMGGFVPLGYDVQGRSLVPNPNEAALVQKIFTLYLELGCVSRLKQELDRADVGSKTWTCRNGTRRGGAQFSRGALYDLLENRLYIGEIRHHKNWYPGLHEAIVPRELWDRVQTQIASNSQQRTIRIREHSSSLLPGLIEDLHGNRFTPSFTVKNKRRYRYYVSRAAIENPGTKFKRPTRWPAKDLETVVLNRLASFLNSEADLFNEYQSADPGTLHRFFVAAKRLVAGWSCLTPSEIRGFVDACISRVVVDPNFVEVLLDRAALSEYLVPAACDGSQTSDSNHSESTIRLRAEAKLQRCGREVCLLIPAPGGDRKVQHRPVPSLIKAVARAHDWYERLLNGDAVSSQSIATATGLGKRYVALVMHFAFLAPDIVEAILDGTQPPDLTFAKMASGIPLSWAEQRERFGFPSAPIA